MCGLVGIWNFDGTVIDPEKLRSMNDLIKHRGPNDEGYFLINTSEGKGTFCYGKETTPSVKEKTSLLKNYSQENFGLGFRRLSIIDTSENGHQPMTSENGRYVIAFNGEIYNYPELKQELIKEGLIFGSNSDTEVLLKSYIRWGESCVNRFNGMWAFVIYDTIEKTFFCSRDRFGVKPFYYHYDGKRLIFASEIKALLCYVPFEPDEDSIYEYLGYGTCSTNESTFFKNIKQLLPGHNIKATKIGITIHKYYQPKRSNSKILFEDAKQKFKDLFFDSVKIRQRSDVPFGYALSGGIDSSSIVCAAFTNKNTHSDITFSLLFKGTKVDETSFVDEVISKTKFKSKTLTVTSNDFEKDFRKFVYYQEEPFGSPSYFGEFKLRELMHNSQIKMSLEGQGADEIVSGYISLIPYYFFDLLRDLKLNELKKERKAFKHYYDVNFIDLVKRYLKYKLIKKESISLSRYPYINWDKIKHKEKINGHEKARDTGSVLNNELLKMLTRTSIPEQLVRADKNSMAFSIESRFPFLDYRLVEFANSLPYSFKINTGTTKVILRESLNEILPLAIYNRKDKIGFAVPNDNLVSKELWSLLNNYITNTGLEFIDKNSFKTIYNSIDKIDWKFWKIVSLAAWHTEYKKISEELLRS